MIKIRLFVKNVFVWACLSRTQLTVVDPSFKFKFLLPKLRNFAHYLSSSNPTPAPSRVHLFYHYFIVVYCILSFYLSLCCLRHFDTSKQAFPMLLHFGLAPLAEDCGIGIRARIWDPDRFGFVGSNSSSATYCLCGLGIINAVLFRFFFCRWW